MNFFFNFLNSARLTISFLLILALNGCVMAQSQEKIYSLMLINFARGIDWPAQTASEKFVIGVFEYPPLVQELGTSPATMKIHGKKMEVRMITSVDESKQCNIVFVPAFKAKVVPDILEKTHQLPMLIVGNKPNLAKQGAGINFVLREGKVLYEINCKEIEKRGLKVSTALKSTGISIN